MNRRFLFLCITAFAIFVVGRAQAAQVCRDDIVDSAPDSRYRNNGDNTVTDLSTDLIWKQCAEGLSGADCSTGSASTFTWQQALQHAEDAVFAGNASWRLPNKNELASLLNWRCFSPAINATIFPSTPVDESFWSSSHDSKGSNVFFVTFTSGSIGLQTTSGTFDRKLYIRLVRTRQ